MSFRYQMSSHNKVLLSAPSLFIQDCEASVGEIESTHLSSKVHLLWWWLTRVWKKDLDQLRSPSRTYTSYQPLEEMQWFEVIFKVFSRLLRCKDVRGWILGFRPRKKIPKLWWASELIQIFLPNTRGLPILSSIDYYVDFKIAVYKCVL